MDERQVLMNKDVTLKINRELHIPTFKRTQNYYVPKDEIDFVEFHSFSLIIKKCWKIHTACFITIF